MMKLTFSLKQIWTTLIIFAIIVPVTIILLWFGISDYNNKFENALSIERQANESLRDNIESEFTRLKTLLQNKSDPLSLLVDKINNVDSLKNINILLKIIIQREHAIREVVVASIQGDIIAAIEPGIGITGDKLLSIEELRSVAIHWGYDKKYERPEVVIPSLGRIYIGSPKKHENFIGFTVAIPIGDPAKAILIARIDVDKLWSKYSNKEYLHGLGDEITRDYILDRRGSLLTKINDSEHNPGALMTHFPITRAALINEKWPGDSSYIGVINQPVFGTKTYIPALHWTLVSEVISSQITEPIWNSIFKIILLTLFGVILFLWFILYLANKTIKPIQNTCDAINHFAKDEYQFSLKPCGIFELDTLTSGFNKMAKARYDAESSLRNREQHLKLYREQAPMATIEWNVDFQVVDWNIAAEKMFGYTVDEVKGRNFVDVMLPKNALVDVKQIWADLISQKGGTYSRNENITKDGRTILCEWHNTPLIDDSGKVFGAASIVQDITERKKKEEHLRQNQKMDALGKVTGGIAHDFNNILGVVQGYADILKDINSDLPEVHKYAEEIHRAGERGSKLTKKLLSFSRLKESNDEILNINTLLLENQDMLEKTLTARISLELDLADDLWNVCIDDSDLEDAILNMSINSMHAINGNGTLTFQTRNTIINKIDENFSQMKAGEYIRLSISDSGVGMDEITKEKIFDPFFTTKGEIGTGLGLSQVYGFVDRCGGDVKVYSELNHGTKISLYFPRSQASKTVESLLSVDKIKVLKGNETILVVDDEPALLELTGIILTEQGYKVFKAERAQQALDILEHESIDLLLSDVIMPDMDGYQLSEIVKEKYPHIKIQLASGFNDNRHIDMENDVIYKNLLHKPYNSQALFERIRELLG